MSVIWTQFSVLILYQNECDYIILDGFFNHVFPTILIFCVDIFLHSVLKVEMVEFAFIEMK